MRKLSPSFRFDPGSLENARPQRDLLGARFLKAAQSGLIDGHGHVIKRGRAVGFVEGELRDAHGDKLVRGQATMQIQARFPERA